MRKREVLELLNRALTSARMDRADFNSIIPLENLPKTEIEVTKFIKDRTRLYRESWIVNPIKRAINLIEQDGKKRGRSEG